MKPTSPPALNPAFSQLHPYPFEKLRTLLASAQSPKGLTPIDLKIGEPKHPTPQLIKDALIEGFPALSNYPPTLGPLVLREAISAWLARRYAIPPLDPEREIMPVLGSKEALYSFVHVVIDPEADRKPGSRGRNVVIMPNPFYQTYEGAALFAGAEPFYLSRWADASVQPDFAEVPEATWARTRILFLCSPDNPTGRVLTLDTWKHIFTLQDRYGFVIAADECYSEIFFDEATPPLGALQAARLLGRSYDNLVIFSSLSKRSNAPGLRSGFVAGDTALVKPYFQYRTYIGGAMSGMVAHASLAAWRDEAHVVENRKKYARKVNELTPLLATALPVEKPDAAFYLWPDVSRYFGGDDMAYTRALYEATGVTLLPGTTLAREAQGTLPGKGRVRIALVSEFDECHEAIHRIVDFTKKL